MKKIHVYNFIGIEECKMAGYSIDNLYDNYPLCGGGFWKSELTKVKSDVTCKGCIKKMNKYKDLKLTIKKNCLVWE